MVRAAVPGGKIGRHGMSKSVAEKLGVRSGLTAHVEGAPDDLALGLPPPSGARRPPDLLLFFVRDAAKIVAAAPRADALYTDGARLWFAYPKRSGAIRTDITRDNGWKPMAARSLLGVTQVALDATWSALRFRRRHEIARLTRKFGQTDGA